ncbi:HAD family hydrolase [Parasphingorhabdus pacifica]
MRWVVFDYGNVISRTTTALPKIAAALGAPVAEFEAVYSAERRAYDAGCTDLEFWRLVGGRLGVEIDEARAAEITAIDEAGWSELDPAALRLVDDLCGTHVRLALLSNAPSSFARSVEQRDWTRPFAQLVFSGDLRVVKPDEQIYRELLSRIAADPAECVFFDDRPENVTAAVRAGMHSHVWRGADEARTALRDHGLDV